MKVRVVRAAARRAAPGRRPAPWIGLVRSVASQASRRGDGGGRTVRE